MKLLLRVLHPALPNLQVPLVLQVRNTVLSFFRNVRDPQIFLVVGDLLPIITEGPESANVYEGDVTHLVCRVDSADPAIVFWQKGDGDAVDTFYSGFALSMNFRWKNTNRGISRKLESHWFRNSANFTVESQ